MFVVFPERDADAKPTGQWLWHLSAANGEIVCQSEAYTKEADAVRGVDDAVAAFADSVQPKIFNEPEEGTPDA